MFDQQHFFLALVLSVGVVTVGIPGVSILLHKFIP